MDECHKPLTNKIDLSNPEGHQIPQNINKPLPLGGPPGQVTIQPQFFFNKDLDYLLTGDKERKIALSISKLKAARYLDFGLEELVPSLWVESEREYDISAVYGITHWWFRRKEFYINKHSESSDREAVRSQMRILSVISVKDTYPILLSFTHCGNKSILRVLRIILVILPEHPSETMVFHNEDGNPARANIKQALGYLKDGDGDGNSQPHKGVKASANSDVMYSFTSAQDGDPLQDDDIPHNPMVFHGHEGAVELSRWFEKTEMVFGISECAEARKVKDFDISAYTKRFHELAQLYPEMVPTERKKIEAYIWGLIDNIKGTVIGSKPTSLNEAVRMAHALMEPKAQARMERIAEGN
ncbi:hypothetical protein Tco_0458869 [Tanacetum coccineum]